MTSNNVCLTIDYERDWGGRVQSTYAIEKMTDKVLEIFDEYGTKGTFFISTETADDTKNQILAIAKAGHEIASHGHDHNIKYNLLSKDDLNYQVGKSKKILEDMTGHAVLGFRTPQFRKNEYTEEMLLENGYKYDSSTVSVSLAGRYEANQHSKELLPLFPVSAIYGRFPAGIKWINMLGSGSISNNPQVIYVHLFDLFDILETVKNYRVNIPFYVLLFYSARIGALMNTLGYFASNSKHLKYYLSDNAQF